MGFSQALSGLNAASSSLDVLGNNIANSQTVGYKSSGAQFADIYAGSTGLGTQVSAVLQDFSDGNIENTGRNLDLAISGDGFYRFEQEGEVVYSRNGQLSMTADGYLENAQGARIMGYGLNAANEVQAGGQPQVIQVPADDMPASATANVATSFNLDAREVAGEGLSQATVSTDVSTPAQTTATEQTIDYHFSNNFSVYDSLGNPRNVTVYYQKDNAAANTWNAQVAMDGHYNAANDFQVTFDANGQLTAPAAPPVINVAAANTTPLGAGPVAMQFNLDLAGSTQFGNTSATNSLTQDGYTSGALVGISIQDDGTVMRNYANEQSVPAGQIALANFRNPEGLEAVGDNAWAATAASGQELVGEAGTGVLGTITSGAVETSNVDLASELVDMIVTQRAYQANSQTISTQDEVLQAAINLSR
ncbi:Flagellar hook protein FlgE [Halomonas sp. THAF12]|uniref:flagellar hook protein FlgE n=1 Tax=Halomonas sp. THAF12 TaxID=2587849 RepID=UPI001269713C|nr:flagellar hook protein FlgE [Halomonas sp. THAF12]QFT86652.1 Flagellar hook protein FlgE [Halomonas sp. THAF12]